MAEITATVTSIESSGRNGPFAIAVPDEDGVDRSEIEGSVTFSLSPKTWKEGRHPEPGDQVQLSDLQLKKGGWRAMEGRFKHGSPQ